MIAIRVCDPAESTTAFTRDWLTWHPDVRMIMIEQTDVSVGASLARYIRTHFSAQRTVVVIAAIDPATVWHRFLPTQRADEIARTLRQNTEAVVCQVAVRVDRSDRDLTLRA